VAQSAIGTVDARHGRYPRRFGQGFEIEKPVADGRDWPATDSAKCSLQCARACCRGGYL